ncbi:MAG: apolipoprotein N-acyltransferase [Gammaproteobacteria bacterium]|nr:apolipoprotein N-acyltransferase [Gammaproteobacteria bacterium]
MPLLSKNWVLALLALLSGAGLTFSFAPYELSLLAPICVAVFYWVLTRKRSGKVFWFGWLFGVGYFGLGVNWVYHSLHLFGAAIAPLAALLTFLFCLALALFPAILASLYQRFQQSHSPLSNALLFAALWALLELLRGKLFGGFPWILVGYSQTTDLLGGLAPAVGVYGIGFLVVLWSALAVGVLQRKSNSSSVLSLCVSVVLLCAIPVSAQIVNRQSFSAPVGSEIQVRLVQANIPQEMKFSQERLVNSINLYTQLTLENLEPNTLVVWPETAIPTYFDRVDEGMQPFVDEMESRGVEVLAGGFHRQDGQVYNSVRQLGGDRALYRKRHLVPFGEFMPLRFLLEPISAFIDIPMSDISSGDGPHIPLQLMGEAVGVSICYEDVYGEEMRALLPESTVLINVSNDAWFGSSAAPHQHEQKARMRAREFARPLVRVTNTGISSAIDYKGRVLGRIPHDELGVFDVQIKPRTGSTLYAKTGNWPVLITALMCILLAMLQRPAGLFRQSNI